MHRGIGVLLHLLQILQPSAAAEKRRSSEFRVPFFWFSMVFYGFLRNFSIIGVDGHQGTTTNRIGRGPGRGGVLVSRGQPRIAGLRFHGQLLVPFPVSNAVKNVLCIIYRMCSKFLFPYTSMTHRRQQLKLNVYIPVEPKFILKTICTNLWFRCLWFLKGLYQPIRII